LADKLFNERAKGKKEGDGKFDRLRLQYQQEVGSILIPVLVHSRIKTVPGDKTIEINEDCIA